MIVFSESSSKIEASFSKRALERNTEFARNSGASIHFIPQSFEDCGGAENALTFVPVQNELTTAFWIGYVPSPEHYQTLYHAALKKRIQLINSPEEFQRAEEFHRYYPLIEDLTMKSITVSSMNEVNRAAAEIGYPLFLKGTIQSLKSEGLKGCVAENEEDLQRICKTLFHQRSRTLGKVIVRSWLPLRHVRKTKDGFPIGREYRLFYLFGKLMAYSYYWEGQDELTKLSPDEEKQVLNLGKTAAERLNVPYVAIDAGQLENRDWKIIEAGDAQFSDICQISGYQLWNNLIQYHMVTRKLP